MSIEKSVFFEKFSYSLFYPQKSTKKAELEQMKVSQDE